MTDSTFPRVWGLDETIEAMSIKFEIHRENWNFCFVYKWLTRTDEVKLDVVLYNFLEEYPGTTNFNKLRWFDK